MLAQLFVGEILIDMDRRLTPVGCTPHDIDARPEGIVRQQLIELVSVLGFQNSLGAGSGVSSARSGLIHLQVCAFRQQRISITLVAVKLEVSLASRLADDEHHDSLLLIKNPAVGQFDLLSLFILTEADDATGIHHIGPGLQQAAQFSIMLTDKQRLTDIHRCNDQDNSQRAAAVNSQFPSLTVDHRLQQTIQGGKHATDDDKRPQRPAEEARGLGVSRIKDVLDGCGIDHHAVGEDEIDGRRVDHRKDRKQDTPHKPHQEHHETGHHKVDRQHDHHQRCQQEEFAARTLIGILGHIVKERYVV